MDYPFSIRAVHKKLLLRLILMGGAIALLLGAVVWIYQHNRIDTEIIDRASHSVRLMEEFSIMQKHVLHGLDIVQRSKWLADALPVVGFHHEKFDGQGYCHHLKGRAIPLAARIFAVADVFDALTSERQYKKAFSLERTMAMMNAERGRHFDPAMLHRFKPIAGKLHELLTGKGPAELQSDLQTIINTYFAPEEAVDDALKTLAPGKHPPSQPSGYSADIA